MTYVWADVLPGQASDDAAINALGNFVEGLDVRTTALENSPIGKLVAYGSRATDSTTITTGELGVLRLDGVPVIAGHRYWTAFSFNLYCATTNDYCAAKLRYSTSGAATTASTAFGVSPQIKTDSFTTNGSTVSGSFVAAATGTVSILFSVVKVTGAGTLKSSGFIEMPIFDGGPSPTSTVVVL